MKKNVIIVGAGFGGLTAARSLKNSDCQILLIDKTNHHLFQPLLYQVATAALSPADIAAPIRSIVYKQKNVTVILSEVKKVDLDSKKVFVSIEEEQEILKEYSYDYLILAVGSKHSYFGKDEWAKYAPGLKTISDALYIREKMLLSFEKAELLNDAKEIEKYLTFVIVGGGPTGVELAGAIAEIAKKTMLKDFRNIDPSKTKIFLIEASDKILPAFDSSLSEKAKQSLTKLGVNILLNSKVTEINKDGVKINGKFIETYNVIWAAGNSIPSLIQSLNVEVDKIGRAIVQKDCSLKNHPEVFVIGDAALFIENNKPLPAIAPVAIQQGKYVANIIKKNITPENREPFKYFDKGIMATIGKAKAVAQISELKFSGLFAWIIWSLVHILYLISFRNRYSVMAEWIWLYITNRNGIRLITHKLNEKK
ncbi:NAD(P)/FAD-dependent oxidoreductase [Ignavibacteria bacterium 4148-Me]|uniref:NAD(P)/FAD-dependent oxidoreductase n=1 Tax=Rosettibacter primus TaxID=3111523 RepID=UPI00336BC6BD